MPKEDLDALLNPPDYLSDIEDGSFEDQINNQFQSSIPAAGNDPYQQALVSTRIVPEMDGKPIRLPGFIVPWNLMMTKPSPSSSWCRFLVPASMSRRRHLTR